jgi:hypothetical protein
MALTATQVKNAKADESKTLRYLDDKGLYLLVKPNGRKSWIYRYMLDGRRRDKGLAPSPRSV